VPEGDCRLQRSVNALAFHVHACVIDGVYEAEAEDVHFHEAAGLSEAAIARVKERVRRRVLKAFVR
jgi:hypothetical protein